MGNAMEVLRADAADRLLEKMDGYLFGAIPRVKFRRSLLLRTIEYHHDGVGANQKKISDTQLVWRVYVRDPSGPVVHLVDIDDSDPLALIPSLRETLRQKIHQTLTAKQFICLMIFQPYNPDSARRAR
jgi:hypothetical protein